MNWWALAELNCGHEAFQASALPTELRAHDFKLKIGHLRRQTGGFEAQRTQKYASPQIHQSSLHLTYFELKVRAMVNCHKLRDMVLTFQRTQQYASTQIYCPSLHLTHFERKFGCIC